MGSLAAVEEEDDACGDSGAPPLRSKGVGDVGEGASATGHAQTARSGRRPRLWRGLGDDVVGPSPNPRRGRGGEMDEDARGSGVVQVEAGIEEARRRRPYPLARASPARRVRRGRRL